MWPNKVRLCKHVLTKHAEIGDRFIIPVKYGKSEYQVFIKIFFNEYRNILEFAYDL